MTSTVPLLRTDLREPASDSPPPTAQLAPILMGIVTWVIGLYVALILESPYWDDDIHNKNLPIVLKASHTSLGTFIWTEISAFATDDARFFPGGLAWSYTLFDVFDNRNSYKLIVSLLLVLALGATALCVAGLAKNWALAGVFILIASGILQVRLWEDGITSFAGLMTLTTTLTLGALWLLLVKSGRWWTVLAGVLYMTALWTYEYVFLFAPVMIVIVVASRKDWRPAIALALPAMFALLTTVALRISTNPHPVPEYTLSFAPGAVLSTFVKQLIAAFPLSQWWLGDIVGLPPIAGTLILMSAALIGIPVFIGLRWFAESLALPSDRVIGLCGLLGVWMWITPPIMIAVTKKWQTTMPWGEAYIPVVYEYFGLALCLLSLWLYVGNRLRASHRGPARRFWGLGGATVFALLSTFTMAANFSLMS